MPRLLKRPEVESDLDEIWWYIAQDSPDNADRFLDRLQERFLALADFPKMGTRRDDIQAGLRSQPVGNYLIFYFPLADGIEIVRVLGVDQAVVSPAAISITAGRAGCSYRDRTDHTG